MKYMKHYSIIQLFNYLLFMIDLSLIYHSFNTTILFAQLRNHQVIDITIILGDIF